MNFTISDYDTIKNYIDGFFRDKFANNNTGDTLILQDGDFHTNIKTLKSRN